MSNEGLRVLFKDKEDKDIAICIMDIAIKDFNENNFYYYDFSLRIYTYIFKLVSDSIISKERSKLINKEIAKLINQSINELID